MRCCARMGDDSDIYDVLCVVQMCVILSRVFYLLTGRISTQKRLTGCDMTYSYDVLVRVVISKRFLLCPFIYFY